MTSDHRDNIPVLEDIIPEHETLPTAEAEAETDEKQKALWIDDETADGAVEEFPAEQDTPGESSTAWNGADGQAGGIDQPATESHAIPYDEHGNIITADGPDEAFEHGGEPHEQTALPDKPVEGADALPTTGTVLSPDNAAEHGRGAAPASDEIPFDQPGPTAADGPPATVQEPIDIDRLAEKILLELAPDIEDYLLRRIRIALKKALGENPPD